MSGCYHLTSFQNFDCISCVSYSKDIVLEDQSLIHVYFNDLISTLYRKDATQNWLGILGKICLCLRNKNRIFQYLRFSVASFGGLLGLLLGFSFVTGFELIYFFTIRPLLDHLTERRKRQTNAVRPM